MFNNSEDEDNDRVMDRVKHLKKQLHFEFKAKKRIYSPVDIRKLKAQIRHMSNEKKLVTAVSNHNVALVKYLLGCGTNPNSTDTHTRTVLHLAVSRGYTDIVKLLLLHGADPNKQDITLNTPLHLAVGIHKFDIVTLLINAKADVNLQNSQGRSAFNLACSKKLQTYWRRSTTEMIKLQEEVQQVVDLLMTVVMKGVQEKFERLNESDINGLHMTKLSLNEAPPEELDNQMSKLLNDIEKFSIA